MEVASGKGEVEGSSPASLLPPPPPPPPPHPCLRQRWVLSQTWRKRRRRSLPFGPPTVCCLEEGSPNRKTKLSNPFYIWEKGSFQNLEKNSVVFVCTEEGLDAFETVSIFFPLKSSGETPCSVVVAEEISRKQNLEGPKTEEEEVWRRRGRGRENNFFSA